MNRNSIQVFERKPPKRFWVKKIVLSIINLSALVYFVKLGIYYLVNCHIGRKMAIVGKNTIIPPTVIIREGQNIVIGSNCYFNHNTILNGGHVRGKLIIGNYVQTGPNVAFYVANHHYTDAMQPIKMQGYIENDIVIEDDVWIGANSVITAGVTIGKGSVIGAGSIVTKDIPPYSIAVGNPAKVIKKRL